LTTIPIGSAQVTARNIYKTKVADYGTELLPALHTAHWTLGAAWRYDITPDRLDKYQDGLTTATPAVATVIVPGTKYEVSFVLDDVTTGFTFTLGGVAGTSLTTSGTHIQYITTTTSADLIISPVATGTRGHFSSISVKAVPTTYYYVGQVVGNIVQTYTISVADTSLPVGAVVTPTTDTTGTEDTFTWKKDVVVGGSQIAVTEAAQGLIEGVEILFSTKVGHVLGDLWTVTVLTPARVNLDGLSNPIGLIVYKNKGGAVVALDGSDMIDGYPAQLILNAAGNHWLLINPATPVFDTTTISAIRYRKNLVAAYTLQYTDQGKELSCIGTFTVTLLSPSAFAGRFVYMSNIGSGSITIDAVAPNKIYGKGDIVGASTFMLEEGVVIQLASNGVDWHILTDTSLTGGYKVFTSSDTFTVPVLVTSVNCLCIGGGASGGGGDAAPGGGGGGGTMVSALITGLTPRDSVVVTVGTGGAGVAKQVDGNDGGDSSFGSYLTAKGGNFGSAAAGTTIGPGGLGGDYNSQAGVLVTGLGCRSNWMSLLTIDFVGSLFTLKSDLDGADGVIVVLLVGGGGSGGISGSAAPGGVGRNDVGLPGSLYGGGGAGGTDNSASGAGADGVVVVWWADARLVT
jgi:hypothetical protein